MDKKTYDAAKKKHLAKIDRETGKIFAAFAKEKKAKKIVTLFDENYLWREKYKPRLDKFLKESEEEYRKLWYAYHKPGEQQKSKGIGAVQKGKTKTTFNKALTFEEAQELANFKGTTNFPDTPHNRAMMRKVFDANLSKLRSKNSIGAVDKFKVIGYDDSITECGHCGRTNLKGTFQVKNQETGQVLNLGSTCAFKAGIFTEKEKKETENLIQRIKKHIASLVRRKVLKKEYTPKEIFNDWFKVYISGKKRENGDYEYQWFSWKKYLKG